MCGSSTMQQLIKFLAEHKYIHQHRLKESTQIVRDIFWAHPESIKLAKCFPHIFLLDCTYETNNDKMALLEIVGVTSTNKTFSVAFAYLEAKRADNFSWALECLKSTLDLNALPSILVTDRELALMDAIKMVYPGAKNFLCRFHIYQDIATVCKKMFDRKGVWNKFVSSWNELVLSRTEEELIHRQSIMDVEFSKYPGALAHVRDFWLSKYKESFVTAWTDRSVHFGNNTMNRVEGGAHAKLKRHMGTTSQGNFIGTWTAINSLLALQHAEIIASFKMSLNTMTHIYRASVFKELRGFVSKAALNVLLAEVKRSELIGPNDWELCGCLLKSTHGLPCAHEIAQYKREGQPIPLASINQHWKKLSNEPGIDPPSNVGTHARPPRKPGVMHESISDEELYDLPEDPEKHALHNDEDTGHNVDTKSKNESYRFVEDLNVNGQSSDVVEMEYEMEEKREEKQDEKEQLDEELDYTRNADSANVDFEVEDDADSKADLPQLEDGMTFLSVIDFKEYLRMVAVQNRFNYRTTKSDKSRVIVACRDMNCKWRCYASVNDKHRFRIKTLVKEHTCQVNRKNGSPKVTIGWVATMIEPNLRARPYKPRHVQDEILKRFRVHISYRMALCARAKALERFSGSYHDEDPPIQKCSQKKCGISKIDRYNSRACKGKVVTKLSVRQQDHMIPSDHQTICQKCGGTGYAEVLVYCNICQASAEHSYCLDKIPKVGDNEVIWSCEECSQAASPNKFSSQPIQENKRRKVEQLQENSSIGVASKTICRDDKNTCKGKLDTKLPVEQCHITDSIDTQVAVCQKCGVTGYVELLVYCNKCRVSAEHRYCFDKLPKIDDDEVIWYCKECVPTASLNNVKSPTN